MARKNPVPDDTPVAPSRQMGNKSSKMKGKAKEIVKEPSSRDTMDEAETLSGACSTSPSSEAPASSSVIQEEKGKAEEVERPEKKSKKRKLAIVVDQKQGEGEGEGPRARESTWDIPDQEDEQTKSGQPPAKKIRGESKQSEASSSKHHQDTQPATKKTPAQNGRGTGKAPQELQTEKPSAVFTPRKPRDWTLTMALPGSILNNVARHDLKTLLVGRIARAATVWCVDEIVVYDDDPTHISNKVSAYYRSKKKSKAEIMDSIEENDIPYQNPDRFMVGLLEYADCPPHLRSALFPMCEPLRYVGLLPPLDTPHHTKPDEWIRFREGIATHPPPAAHKAKASKAGKEWTHIICGLPYPVRVPYQIPEGVRITVEFKDEQPRSWPRLSERECEDLTVDAVSPAAPREQDGYYWGYQVRRAASFSDIFQHTDFEDGYDLTIGTSERGVPLASILPHAIAPRNCPSSSNRKLPDAFRHILVIFGGVSGLEPVVANDPAIKGVKLKKETAHEAFDYWVNLVEGQGSRTVRTEEAVEIGLGGLKGYVDYQFEHVD